MGYDLGIGVGVEAVALPLELAPQLDMVVDLAVEDRVDGSGLVLYRLPATGAVDHGQPSHREADASLDVEPLAVGAPVAEGAAHAEQACRVDGPAALTGHHSGDAAHSASQTPPSGLPPAGVKEEGTPEHASRVPAARAATDAPSACRAASGTRDSGSGTAARAAGAPGRAARTRPGHGVASTAARVADALRGSRRRHPRRGAARPRADACRTRTLPVADSPGRRGPAGHPIRGSVPRGRPPHPVARP